MNSTLAAPTFVDRPQYHPDTGRLVEPGSVRCGCGRKHWLGFMADSECEHCGQLFNAFGQRLQSLTGDESGDY